MKRAIPAAFAIALVSVIGNIAACSSSDGPPSAPVAIEAGTFEAAAPLPLSKYKAPVEAGSNLFVQFGAAGAPAACAVKPTPDPAVVKSCILRTGCGYIIPPFTLSDCISKNLIETDNFADCIKGASSCADTNECLGQGKYGPQCPFGEQGTHCYDNKKILNCSTGIAPTFLDCSKTGQQCVPDEPDSSVTSYPCLGIFGDGLPSYPDPAVDCADYNYYPGACFPTGNGEGGVGDVYIAYCQFQTTMFTNCTAQGMECVPFETGAECRRPTGQKCPTTDISEGCEGSKLYTCNAGRKETHDCTTSGLSCIAANGKADCLLSGCTVDDAEKCTESCDGPYANVCVGGGRYVVDCRAYGFNGCQTFTSTSDALKGDYAHCVLN